MFFEKRVVGYFNYSLIFKTVLVFLQENARTQPEVTSANVPKVTDSPPTATAASTSTSASKRSASVSTGSATTPTAASCANAMKAGSCHQMEPSALTSGRSRVTMSTRESFASVPGPRT